MTVALSVLQSAINCFLNFEKAFKTYFSKGDDNTQLANLTKCLKELREANAPQKDVYTHPMSWIVCEEDPLITNTKELFEHCIKVIQEFIPLLGGRVTQTYTIEKPLQTYLGWKGWQQQGEQINVSNRALGRLLEKFASETAEPNKIYTEIACFHQSVEYIVDCFCMQKYPKSEAIKEIYEKHEFQFITTVEPYYRTLDSIQIQSEEEKTESTTEQKKPGYFSSIWGNSTENEG